ncbi:MAG: phosphatidate cytidylyltransferase [Cyanobacteriota bacterium]|nr:phosphatidate cytidylyltransferase [Cyanobacteriota bacterium]
MTPHLSMPWLSSVLGTHPVSLALYQMGGVILALLLLASLIVELLKRARPQGDFSSLTQRIKAWWVMVAIFLLSLMIHPKAAVALFALLSFLGLKEFFTLIHTRVEDHRALLWAFLAIPVQYLLIAFNNAPVAWIFIPVYMFLWVPVRLILVGQTRGIIDAMARIQWGLMACVFCISHVPLLLTMRPNPALPNGPQALLLALVFLTEFNDVAQYCWGQSLGRHKISPAISPNKTVEGFWGGVISTTLVAPALMFLTGFSFNLSILIGLVIAVAGFCGDLVMSAVKRDVGVKDASQLIPGHGGMLDRIDSLTFTAPLFYHLVNYVFY